MHLLGHMQEPLVQTELFLSGTHKWFVAFTNFKEFKYDTKIN